ncbi:MAG: isoleucine--tRNA ligase [Bacillota bacterium]|nr:isoleucine--tRNA ligase [Bacillota bacterium]
MSNEGKPNFVKMEHDILGFWEEHRCFDKLREKNKANQRFRFLDGPITANNPMGIHHAWGRSIKDIVLRYKAMNGYSCHYRNGFDTQGLWVEVEVEKELGFRDKKDIEAYGMEKFTRKCVDRIKHFSGVITTQSKRLGQWMDWENSYYTHTDENISAIWHFLKICHTNGWLVKSHRPMPWCPRCGTSLSEHEMSGSHKDITHNAVFAIAPAKHADFDMLVWTTTPWTLSANVALAVNPELDYALVKCEGHKRPLALAKAAIKHIEGEKQVLRLLKGNELVGLEYETFFPHLPVQKDLRHTVIPWDDVDANEGCGIVHIAPGCGAEDYELGKSFSLREICPIDESGVFFGEYDFLSGFSATQAAPIVFEFLQKQGKLYKTHVYTHRYPVCWRCKTEVLFRSVSEWSIKTDDIRPKLIHAAEAVKWEPPFIGKRMNDWLQNMGDWNISRKRFYGLPLPFYPCETCGKLTVTGSKDELALLGGADVDKLPELHRPWIDSIKIKCPHCGALVSRIPEVGDVWLDAGIAPFSTLGYFTDRDEWEKNFPAEWVIEMQEQVRLWFYAQLFMSVSITGRAPYERVQTNNWVLAEDGTKFSKTGYMIRFDEAAERLGSDAIRYLFAGASMVSDVRFGYTLGEEARRKILSFWNIFSFFMTYAEIDKPVITTSISADVTDVWLQNRVNDFVHKAAMHYEKFSFAELIREFELCTDDVSNWYVRINRRRFWKNTLDADKQGAYDTLFYTIHAMTQVMAPVLPFMTEHIWQNMTLKYGSGEESVHLSDFPKAGNVEEAVLKNVEEVRAVITQALKLRNDRNIKVKQPLSMMYLDKEMAHVCAPYCDIIKDELNIKEIDYLNDFSSLSIEYLSLNFQVAGKQLKGDLNRVKALCDNLTDDEMASCVYDYKKGNPVMIVGYDYPLPADLFNLSSIEKEHIVKSQNGVLVALNTEITDDLKTEGLYREILRHCQILRKEAGFAVSDKVLLDFETAVPSLTAVIHEYATDIMRETISEIRPVQAPVMTKEIQLGEGALTAKIARIKPAKEVHA